MSEPVAPKGPVKAGSPRADGEPRAAPEHEYRVSLPAFEGPLDLLLHLIQKHELNVMDIPIGFITEKYVEYISMMQELSIDIASDYLVMAATLAHIKSKMLLPAAPDDSEDVEEIEEDPRADLVRRLLEYQKYRLAAEHLGTRAVLGRDLFARGMAAPTVEGPAPLAPVSMFKLLDALESVFKRVKQTKEHLINFDRISISDRINQLSDVLRERRVLLFEDLFDGDRTRADVIVTFLALLEMTRLRLTRIFQEQPFDPIRIELAVQDDEEAAAGKVIAAEPEPGAPAAAEAAPKTEASPTPEAVDSAFPEEFGLQEEGELAPPWDLDGGVAEGESLEEASGGAESEDAETGET